MRDLRTGSNFSDVLSILRTVTHVTVTLLIVLFVMLFSLNKRPIYEVYPVTLLTEQTYSLDDYIAIIITRFDEIYVNRRPALVASVRAYIERLRAEDRKRPILIRVEPETSNDLVVKVLRQAELASIKTVSIVLVAPPPEDPNSRYKGRKRVRW